MAEVSIALLDTSIFIAHESGRALKSVEAAEVAVSVVTIAELRWGVLAAVDEGARSTRLDTLQSALRLEPVQVDDRVAAAWALLRQRLRSRGLKMPGNDSWIAATALAFGWPIATQDADYPDGIPDLRVIRV